MIWEILISFSEQWSLLRNNDHFWEIIITSYSPSAAGILLDSVFRPCFYQTSESILKLDNIQLYISVYFEHLRWVCFEVYVSNILYILKHISRPERPVQSVPWSGSSRPVIVWGWLVLLVGSSQHLNINGKNRKNWQWSWTKTYMDIILG